MGESKHVDMYCLGTSRVSCATMWRGQVPKIPSRGLQCASTHRAKGIPISGWWPEASSMPDQMPYVRTCWRDQKPFSGQAWCLAYIAMGSKASPRLGWVQWVYFNGADSLVYYLSLNHFYCENQFSRWLLSHSNPDTWRAPQNQEA